MTQNAKITFYPLRVEGMVPKGITILEAARRLGVDMEGPCGGAGRCGRDLIQVRINKTLQTVLACKTTVENDLEVIVPSHEKKALQIVEGFYVKSNSRCNINPSIRKEVVRNGHGLCSTRVYVGSELISSEDGDTRSQVYGISLDIGTTTLVASLVDLNSGEVLSSTSTLNPLVYYGHDVMSRIKYSTSQKDGLFRMHRELVSTINLLIHFLALEKDVRTENIYQIIAAGNTTMQHIFLNKEIKGIGEYPYEPEILDVYTTTAKELSIDIPGYAPVTTFPCISAYVGGDIVSGLLAIDHKTLELPALFLDIGTNGELVLLLDDRMVATSTAAGPCFEGMTISSGMRASEGAIEHVCIDGGISMEVIGNCAPRGICGSGLLDIVSELVRIGLVNPRGRLQSPDNGNNIIQQTATKSFLPGCNPIALLSSSNSIPPIVRLSAHDEVKEGEGGCKDTGKIKESLHSNTIKYKKNLFEQDGKRHFRLTDTVSISQGDIRQVQLAKAAIRAGIEILLARCNVNAGKLKTIIIAGGFGYHLNERSLFGIGLLPEVTNAKLSFVGNSSLGGAVRVLLNKKLVNDAIRIARTAQVVELSQIPYFERVFIGKMHF